MQHPFQEFGYRFIGNQIVHIDVITLADHIGTVVNKNQR